MGRGHDTPSCMTTLRLSYLRLRLLQVWPSVRPSVKENSAGPRESELVMTLYRMAGNASVSLYEPRVTHAMPTDTQIGERACTGCGGPFPAKAIMAEAMQSTMSPACLRSEAAYQNRTLVWPVQFRDVCQFCPAEPSANRELATCSAACSAPESGLDSPCVGMTRTSGRILVPALMGAHLPDDL